MNIRFFIDKKGRRMKMRETVKKVMCFTLSSVLLAQLYIPIYASEKYMDDEHKQVPESNGETYSYTSMDEDGRISVIELPEVDEEAIEREQLANADAYELVVKLGNSEQVIGTYDDLSQAQQAQWMRSMYRSAGTAQVRAVTNYANISYGVVDFHTKTSQYNTNYTEVGTNAGGYLNGSYSGDGAFLGYCDANETKVKFRVGGVTGCVNASEVIIREYDDVKSVSSYMVKDGYLFHYITTNVTLPYYANAINVGPMQDYMKNGTPYFSYDGHYFYTSYKAMINDYKNNTYANSINASQPYYSYYQYLSHRTKTNITAAQINAFLDDMINGRVSGMKDTGQAFIDNQNAYGANALLMVGVAANESAYGTSSIAAEKNNLFGHNATDYNPSGNANAYASPAESIAHHARDYISNGYLDPKDYSGRYHGAHLGDKESGMGVKYASDPYWGEKAAAVAYAIDRRYGNTDFGTYQIGMKAKMTNLNVRSEATSSSSGLYQTGNWGSYPVTVLSQTTGQSVGGNSTWYKIQTDPTLNDSRTAMTQDVGFYNFNRDYAYVSSAYIDLVKYSNVNSNIPDEKPTPKPDPEPTPDPEPEPTPTPDPTPSALKPAEIISKLSLKTSGNYLSGVTLGQNVSDFMNKLKGVESSASIVMKNASGSAITSGLLATGQSLTITSGGTSTTYQIVVYGDTNGDGKILANDYVFIRNYIMGTNTLNGAYKEAADVNRDGKVLANDYVLIRNHIMGSSSITQ